MTVYVDSLVRWGWRLRGRPVPSCHLFTDTLDLHELHALAARIGLQRRWFQNHPLAPHYDLTPAKREQAIALGAIVVTRREAVAIWRHRRSEALHSR